MWQAWAQGCNSYNHIFWIDCDKCGCWVHTACAFGNSLIMDREQSEMDDTQAESVREAVAPGRAAPAPVVCLFAKDIVSIASTVAEILWHQGLSERERAYVWRGISLGNTGQVYIYNPCPFYSPQSAIYVGKVAW